MDYILHSFGAANTSFNDVFACLTFCKIILMQNITIAGECIVI